MSYQVGVMLAVAMLLMAGGAYMLVRLRSSRISERRVYAYRMTGIMLVSGGFVLAMSATAMWRWSMTP